MPENPLDRLRDLCLALPATTERRSHGEPAWFVRDKKLFVTYADHHHDDRLAFWCAAPEGAQDELTASDPTHYFVPPYVGHRGWLGVFLDVELDWEEISALVVDAYRIVAPKGLLTELDKEREPSRRSQSSRTKLLEICRKLPEVDSEDDQHIAFLVRKRKFAYYLEDHHGDGRVALACKAGPGENTGLVDSDPARFFIPSYIGPRGWVGMWLDLPEVDWDEVGELVAESYRLTAPKLLWRQVEQAR